MHLAKLRGQRRRRHRVADLPAGRVIGLAERADDEAARGELGVARHALVLHAVEDDVLVDLVADDQDIGAVDERDELAGCPPRVKTAPAGLCGELIMSSRVFGVTAARTASQSERVVGIAQRHDDRHAAAQLDRRDVGVVARLERRWLRRPDGRRAATASKIASVPPEVTVTSVSGS